MPIKRIQIPSKVLNTWYLKSKELTHYQISKGANISKVTVGTVFASSKGTPEVVNKLTAFFNDSNAINVAKQFTESKKQVA